MTNEKKETNLEHYYDEIMERYQKIGTEKLEMAISLIYIKYNKKPSSFSMGEALLWLGEPYKKPKIKLTKFEYDLLRTNDQSHDRTIGSYATYKNMHEVGYYKDVDFNLTINEILENCEVESD